jgi:hypothetical protein
MDSAEAERVSSALRAQEACLTRQEEFQTAMASQMGQVSTQLQDIIGQLTCQTAPAPLPTPEVTPTFPIPLIGAGSKLAPPGRYAGEKSDKKRFFIDCSILF